MCQEQPEHPLTAGAALKACTEKCVQIMPSRSCPLPAPGLLLQCACAPATVGLSMRCFTFQREPLTACQQAACCCSTCTRARDA